MLSNEELLNVKGGSLSGAIISAISELMNKIFDFGRSLGTNLNRIIKKNYCK